jgi:beta-glucanase (GH16 family)
MDRRSTHGLVVALFATAVLASCVAPPPTGEGFELVFVDDFDGTQPTPDVWGDAPFGGSLPATVADGVLTIQSTQANGYQWGYLASTGPRADTEPNYARPFAWQEGYFEARIRLTESAWAWPAFALFSMAKTEAWPEEDCSALTSEWDIMENGVEMSDGSRPSPDWYFTALHRNTPDGTSDGYCGVIDTQRTFGKDYTGTDLSDWHTWAGHWTADRLCTYLDGVEVQCVEPYDTTSQPMHLVFTIQYLRRCDGCGERPTALELKVDWVRVWQMP